MSLICKLWPIQICTMPDRLSTKECTLCPSVVIVKHLAGGCHFTADNAFNRLAMEQLYLYLILITVESPICNGTKCIMGSSTLFCNAAAKSEASIVVLSTGCNRFGRYGKVNRPLPLDLSNGGSDPMRDIKRTFKISGVGGGRRIFHYQADTVNQVLYLQDKYYPCQTQRNKVAGVGGDGGQNNLNTQQNKKAEAAPYDDNWIPKEALANIGDENLKINKRAASTRRDREFAEAPQNEKRNRMILKYTTTDGSQVILTGTDNKKNSVYMVLDKANKQYALSESTLEAGKY